MRLPRVRFTVRRMMVGVAVVAGLASLEAMRRRSSDLRERAESHKTEAFDLAIQLRPDPDHRWEAFWFSNDKCPPVPKPYSPAVFRDWQEGQARRIAYHVMLYRKYGRAAARPW